MAVVIGVPSGIVAAAHRGSIWDRVLMLGSLLGVCIPGFWLSLNFIYLFAVRLGWLPAAGYASIFTDPVSALRYMVLPAVSLGFNQSALIARISRSCMLEALQQDYVRTAQAKGLSQRAVTYVHAFRNALVPVVTVIGVTTAVLIGGAVITEIVFNIPGLGPARHLRDPAPRLPGRAGRGAGDRGDLRADQPRGGRALRLHRSADPL